MCVSLSAHEHIRVHACTQRVKQFFWALDGGTTTEPFLGHPNQVPPPKKNITCVVLDD